MGPKDDFGYQAMLVCSSIFFGGIFYGVAEFNKVDTLPCALIKMGPALLCGLHSLRLESLAHKRLPPRCEPASIYCRTMVFGFILCSLGDLFLKLDDSQPASSTKYFICGLVAFLLGHIMFVGAFVFDGGNTRCIAWGVFSYAYVLVILYFSLPNIHKVVLSVGVTVYALVIGTMLHRSASLAIDKFPNERSSMIALVGAFVFLVSDTVLAINRFVTPLPHSRAINISAYFLGIALLAVSCAGTGRWKRAKIND